MNFLLILLAKLYITSIFEFIINIINSNIFFQRSMTKSKLKLFSTILREYFFAKNSINFFVWLDILLIWEINLIEKSRSLFHLSSLNIIFSNINILISQNLYKILQILKLRVWKNIETMIFFCCNRIRSQILQ